MAGLYIHIPFCKQACYYCDFHFSTNVKQVDQLIEAIVIELRIQKPYLETEKIDTIYLGGGTPSILPIPEIEKILAGVNHNYSTSDKPEITAEANPDDLTEEKLKGLKALGINRLSIGIQSFQDELLKFLNRAHDSSTAIKSYRLARVLGFSNISLDLIFSIPGQSLSQLEDDLVTILDLHPEHISIYGLTIEEKTVFGNWAKKKKFREVSDEDSARQFDLIMNVLEGGGYEQYEISNFSRDQNYSKHNTSYWSDKHYLGVGPGAHSYNGKFRQFNVSNNRKYIRSIELGKVPFSIDELNPKSKANDYLLTSLRTKWGCDLDKLRSDYNYPFLQTQKEIVDRFVSDELIKFDGDKIYLTRKGKFLADEIIGDLFWI